MLSFVVCRLKKRPDDNIHEYIRSHPEVFPFLSFVKINSIEKLGTCPSMDEARRIIF